jgi:dihydrofolate reductase
MRRLVVFNQVSLDGYFCDVHGDMSWAHKQDAEWGAFSEENASGGGQLLFGRITYEMMASWWPTPRAAATYPVVAERMNNLSKVVFSKTLHDASWSNTTLLNGDLPTQVRQLKSEPGPNLVIMGSGSIVSQLAGEGLIDEYQVVVNPVVLGAGRTMFDEGKHRLMLQRTTVRTFDNGNVFLCYEPLA